MHSILVDLDGTIFNSAPGIIGSFQHTLRCLGAQCPPDEELMWVVGPPLRRSFPKLIGPDLDVEEAVRLYREHYVVNGIFNGSGYPGMPQALTSLQALPARLFVCTAKATGFAEKIIAHLGLTDLFDGIYGADLEGKFDDKGLLIEHIIGVEQLDPAHAVMIGDRANDMLAASRNAIRAVGVLWGYGDADELTQAGATVLCPTPDRLVDVVRDSIEA